MLPPRILDLVLGAAVATGLLACARDGSPEGAARDAPNVLLVVIDDLRLDLGCYGDSSAHTPHLDALAAHGTVFTHAYSQAVICNPSRVSFLTGLRPTTSGFLAREGHFRDVLPDVVTLPQHFRAHGYRTVSSGKVFDREDERSWDEVVDLGDVPKYRDPETMARIERAMSAARAAGLRRKALLAAAQGPITEALDVADDAYHDGVAASRAAEFLASPRAREKPFFLAVGFRRPHLPFAAPQRYWDLHADLAFTPPGRPSAGVPEYSLNRPDEFKSYAEVPKRGPIDAQLGLQIQRGYRACVSYVDEQLGRVLAAVEGAGFADDTIVVVVSDQGFKLGEHGAWGKNALHETDTRVPLILRAPGHGPAVTSGLVELVDLYPTLSELARLPAPEHVEGTSFAPLLLDPEREWKRGALSHVLRDGGDKSYVGTTLRTGDHRLVRWQERGGRGEVFELYDHTSDPAEQTSLAQDPAQRALVEELSRKLDDWRTLRPAGAR